jgi:hypothetical protein
VSRPCDWQGRSSPLAGTPKARGATDSGTSAHCRHMQPPSADPRRAAGPNASVIIHTLKRRSDPKHDVRYRKEGGVGNARGPKRKAGRRPVRPRASAVQIANRSTCRRRPASGMSIELVRPGLCVSSMTVLTTAHPLVVNEDGCLVSCRRSRCDRLRSCRRPRRAVTAGRSFPGPPRYRPRPRRWCGRWAGPAPCRPRPASS